jgi:nitrogen regulatory protein PII
MKLIIAYIQPHKLEDVKRALAQAEVGKMSVTNSLGCGAQMGYEESYRGIKFEVNLLKKIRLEIAVSEPFLQKTVDTIICLGPHRRDRRREDFRPGHDRLHPHPHRRTRPRRHRLTASAG